MEVTAKELRTRTKSLLEAVERGEEVVITYRGKARARIVGVEAPAEERQEVELFGIWRDHGPSEDVQRYVDELRRPRH